MIIINIAPENKLSFSAHTVKPVLHHFSSPQNTSVGDVLVLECEFGGIPRPTVQWMKDDVQLVENRRLLIITPSANPDLSLVVISPVPDLLMLDCTLVLEPMQLAMALCLGRSKWTSLVVSMYDNSVEI